MSAGVRGEAHRVRGFQPGDVAQMEEIARSAPEAAGWTRNAFKSMEMAGERGWVIETESRVTGFVVVRVVLSEAEILNLAIEAPQRRSGQASRLLEEVLITLRRAGVQRIFLEVRASNAAAIAFYQRHGFAEIGRRPGYYRDPDEAALCMKKILTG
jgi:ribosomal-protein-alanine N-acetyltransferase